MSKALNKTGRPIMYSCSWPAYIKDVSTDLHCTPYIHSLVMRPLSVLLKTNRGRVTRLVFQCYHDRPEILNFGGGKGVYLGLKLSLMADHSKNMYVHLTILQFIRENSPQSERDFMDVLGESITSNKGDA